MRDAIPPLATLGRRISILGRSNAGKSTLAFALAERLGLTPIYLDRLAFLPNTDWVLRPDDDFGALHDEAVTGEGWVMEGNYSRLMPQRLARATAIILIDTPVPTSLVRYVRRTLFERGRIGAIDGDRDSLKWEMIRHIFFVQGKNMRRYRVMLADWQKAATVISSGRELRALYEAWNLRRP